MTIKSHQQLIEQYEECKKLIEKCHKKTIPLEVLVIAIVCGMKAIQTSASLTLNIIATTCVGMLVVGHFWDFKYQRSIERKITDIILEGVELEKRNPFAGLSFFQDYLQKFNVMGKMASLAIFDFAFLYFFSVSVTQLIKIIDPAIVAKLTSTTPLRTFVISACLGWAYYLPLRPLVHAKRSMEEIKGT